MKAILVAAFCMATGAAWAQSEPIACATIADAAARLACYDSQAKKKEPSATPEVEPKTGAWKLTESSSPIDDSPQLVAILLDTGNDMGLVVRCKEHRTELFLSPGSLFIGSSEEPTVLMRIDKKKPVTQTWIGSTDGRAAFARKPIDTLKSLSEGNLVFFRVGGFNGSQADATFDLDGISVVREKIAKICDWK